MQKLRRKKVLVTGGCGFIGSHLVDRLAVDNDVTVIDDLSSGVESNLDRSAGNITFVKGDICDSGMLMKAMRGVEIVFHLAAKVNVEESAMNPHHYEVVNAYGTANVLSACQQCGVKRLVYSSTAAVYGEGAKRTEDDFVSPSSPYGWAKLRGEWYCLDSSIPTVILRYFNVYGSRQGNNGCVLPSFLRRMQEGKPLVVYGDGKQTRDFVFVDDVVNATVLAASVPIKGYNVFNVGTGEEVSINDIVDILNKINGGEIPIRYEGYRAGDIMRSSANTEKASRVLGYSAITKINEGIKRLWAK